MSSPPVEVVLGDAVVVVAGAAVVVVVAAVVAGSVVTEAVGWPLPQEVKTAAASTTGSTRRWFTDEGYDSPLPSASIRQEGCRVAGHYEAPPELSIDLSKTYTARLDTSAGSITMDLFAADAPLAVNNFAFLATEGYYDGVIFHRVIDGFVIQGGDPTGTGRGGPGYQFRDEFHSKTTYDRGTVAMANAGPNTNGSQFFICHQNVGLPNQYTIFGRVTDGMDVVDAIATAPTGAQDRPQDPVTIDSVAVTEG